ACDFSYNEQILRKSKVVNLNLKNVPLEKALDKLFIDQPFKYELVDGIIVVKIIQKETKLNNKNVDFVLPVDSKQHQSIRGRVVDENGKPLVGASVQIIGTSNVTQTNQNGNFILETDRQSAVVKIQFVGYTTK